MLKLAMVPPMVYRGCVGGGIMNRRNNIGRSSVVSVFRLNRISVTPIMKMGIDKR